MADGWKNRIVGTDVKPASWFLASEKNWRIHPANQQSALLGSLSEVGWVQDVIVNRRSDPSWGTDRGVETLVDGHLRVSLALREGEETPIPVKYVDLLPGEENIILSSFDPITALAVADKEKLDALLRDTKAADAALQQMLSDLAAREGLYTGDGGELDSAGGPEQPHISLSERFLVPPFSVLDARQGYWQERKRAWLALGIQSELGRGEATTPGSPSDHRPGRNGGDYDGGHAWLSGRKSSRADNGLQGESLQGRSHYKAAPGGSLRPAMSLGPDGKTRRGDGRGRPMHGEA